MTPLKTNSNANVAKNPAMILKSKEGLYICNNISKSVGNFGVCGFIALHVFFK